MSTKLEQRFWRLFTDYERLTQDESVAIHARDFDAVDKLQSGKPALFEELCGLAAKVGIDRRNTVLSTRLDALTTLETASEQRLAVMLRETRAERQNLDLVRQRLRGLNSSYGPDSRRPQAFHAHG